MSSTVLWKIVIKLAWEKLVDLMKSLNVCLSIVAYALRILFNESLYHILSFIMLMFGVDFCIFQSKQGQCVYVLMYANANNCSCKCAHKYPQPLIMLRKKIVDEKHFNSLN